MRLYISFAKTHSHERSRWMKRRRAENRSVFLHGVPIHVKESFAVADHPCTWGIPGLKDSKETGFLIPMFARRRSFVCGTLTQTAL